MPSPYVLVMYGPCKTCIAWLVTEPELFATGFAVADTPPTSVAIAGEHVNNATTGRRYLWYLLRLLLYWCVELLSGSEAQVRDTFPSSEMQHLVF